MNGQDFILPENVNGIHIHFVGIKGTGMAALVEILHARGAVITGSDVSERFYTDEILEKYSIKALPFSEDNITDDVQIVVHSSAYSPEKNPDLIAAQKKGIPLLLYSEALGEVSRLCCSVGICGVHGKTTTTGLTGTILKNLDLSSQVLAGSIISSFGDSCTMTSRNVKSESPKYFVAETCEYQRHFMAYHPSVIVLTSVESDHQDYYPTYQDIRDAFVEYICLLPHGGKLIYCADDPGAVEAAGIAGAKRPDIKMIPYGVKADGEYKLEFGEIAGGRHNFSLPFEKNLAISVPGDHNVKNACAAIAVCRELLKKEGEDPSSHIEEIKKALLSFAGGKRRSEIVGQAVTPSGNKVIFIDDYGHHPTAIKTTLAGYRDFYRGFKIIVDFMSHTYTRTAALLEEFASSFADADVVIINKIYGSAREDGSKASVTGEILAEHAKKYHKNVIYAGEFDEAAKIGQDILNKKPQQGYSEGYLFVTMGAGDNWKVGSSILKALESGQEVQ
ncbi:MAG: UDP-N-acetylmuramate--L-alanine ligase [Treponema sp.]|nr:UDP-N-acetylmuramate--L-alanine ligase [Treponema sp.]